MNASELSAERLNLYLFIETFDDEKLEISCNFCEENEPGSTFYSGGMLGQSTTGWLAVAAQHVLDNHPET